MWIMGGVVLQDLVILMPSKAKKQYLCALNVYYDRVRKNCGIRGHNPPFLSFFEFFFSLSLSKHPVKLGGVGHCFAWQGTRPTGGLVVSVCQHIIYWNKFYNFFFLGGAFKGSQLRIILLDVL